MSAMILALTAQVLIGGQMNGQAVITNQSGGDVYAITAAHVLRSQPKTFSLKLNGKECKATKVLTHTKKDVAFIFLKDCKLLDKNYSIHVGTKPVIGDKVTILADNVVGGMLKIGEVTKGIHDCDYKNLGLGYVRCFVVEMKIQGGDSGGGCWHNGTLLGIVSAYSYRTISGVSKRKHRALCVPLMAQ